MKLVGRVPVEPLDDERMTNIERRVVAGAADAAARPGGVHAPRRGFALAFAAVALAAMVAGVIGWKLRGAPTMQAPAVAETQLAVTTEPRGGTLSIGDATIHSTPGTVFAVTRPDGGVLVDLTKGKVELQVGKRGDRPPLVVRAGDTDVIVVGTRFSVDYGDGTGDVDVRVTEGVVKVVRRHHDEVRVAAGSAWATQRGVIALADARPLPTATSPDVTAAAGGSDATTVATAEPTKGSGAFEIDMGTGPDVLHGRTAQVPDGRSPGRPIPSGTGAAGRPETQERTPTGSGGSGAGDTATGEPNLAALIQKQPLDPPMDVGESVDMGAVSRYQQIIREQKGEQESRAYYGIAYTQAMKLGRTDEALATIRSYELRFAQGRIYPERQAIAWLKLRILCKRGLGEQCRQAAEAYIRIAPDGPPRHLAEGVTTH